MPDSFTCDIRPLMRVARRAHDFGGKAMKATRAHFTSGVTNLQRFFTQEALTGRPGLNMVSGKTILSLRTASTSTPTGATMEVSSNHPGIRTHMLGLRIVPRARQYLAIPLGMSWINAALYYGKPINPWLRPISKGGNNYLIDNSGKAVFHLRTSVNIPKRIFADKILKKFLKSPLGPIGSGLLWRLATHAVKK